MRLNQRGNFERMMKAYMHKYSSVVKVKDPKTGRMVNKRVAGDMPRVTESDLVLIQPISASGQNLFTFPILENVGSPLPEEIRLNQNDEFTVCEVGMFIYGALSSTSAVVKSRKIWSYAPTELTDAVSVVEDFWLGVFSISINNVGWVDKWFMRKHYDSKITVTQNYGTATTGAEAAKIPGQNGHETGFIEMTPTITLSGAKKYSIQMTLPYPISEITATTNVAYEDQAANGAVYTFDHVMLVLRGFNAQNAASFQTEKPKATRKK